MKKLIHVFLFAVLTSVAVSCNTDEAESVASERMLGTWQLKQYFSDGDSADGLVEEHMLDECTKTSILVIESQRFESKNYLDNTQSGDPNNCIAETLSGDWGFQTDGTYLLMYDVNQIGAGDATGLSVELKNNELIATALFANSTRINRSVYTKQE